MASFACDDESLRRGSAIATVTGAICDDATKLFVPEANVVLIEKDQSGTIVSQQDAVTDQEGKFQFKRVASGTHELRAEKGTFTYVGSVTVRGTKDTEIPLQDCDYPTGIVTGRFCDSTEGQWVSGASVYVAGPKGAVDAPLPTDASGAFTLTGVPSGNRDIIADKDGKKYVVPMIVRAGETVDLGVNDCVKGNLSNIEGQICANAPGYWLSGAAVTTTANGNTYQTETDVDGKFVLSELPAGDYHVNVDKGAFHLEFDSTTVATKSTRLDGPKCTSSNVPVVVVSGNYDAMQKVMKRLQFANISIFKGYDGHNEIDDLVATRTDASWSASLLDGPSPEIFNYKIAMFNSGCDAADLGAFGSDQYQRRLQNLRKYVSDGNFLYISDNAFFLIASSFGSPLAFFGADRAPGFGVGPVMLAATVQDSTLAARLGGASYQANMRIGEWGAVSNVGPAVKVYMNATVTVSNMAGTIASSPLLMSFPITKGRVIYSALQTKDQPATTIDKLMDYLIFEL